MNLDNQTYIALSVAMFFQFAVWGAWAPVLAARLLGPLKMTGKQTGWIYATLPIACIISPLVAGWLADMYIDMKWILIVCHFVGAVLLFVAAKQQKFAPLLDRDVPLLAVLCGHAAAGQRGPVPRRSEWYRTGHGVRVGARLVGLGRLVVDRLARHTQDSRRRQ